MNIPKIIHYVWVGGKPIPKKIKQIINHNEKILGKEWKTKIWTEKDFDIESNPFTKYWYEKKEWAFVSDYIRAYAVFKMGGWYLDTDIRLSKSLDNLKDSKYIASRTFFVENTASIFGSIKDNPITKTYLDTMCSKNLINKPPRIMSTDIHTYAIRKHFDIPDNNNNFLSDDISIYTEEVLQINLGENNIAIHEHHDNWKGNSNLSVSKYYTRKVRVFNSYSPKVLSKYTKKRDKMIKKIQKLLIK